MSIEVRRVTTHEDRKLFVRVPFAVMREDPNWVPPIERMQLEFIDPAKNPFFEHGEAELLIAFRDGRLAGRISAQTDDIHLERYSDNTGLFGFFDTVDDPRVCAALVAACEAWHRSRGRARVLGPYNFNINGEVGVLTEGFDAPNYILMNHNPPYYGERLEECGLRKAKDLYAWHRVATGEADELAREAAAIRCANGNVTVRPLDMRRLNEELTTVNAIFNESWANNWGYVPLTFGEINKMARDLKLIIDPAITTILEVGGAPAGMAISLPNVNECLRGLNGCRSLLNLARFVWRLRLRRPRGVRTLLVGLRPEHRGRGLSRLLMLENELKWRAAGYRESEISWTLEDNFKINRAVERAGSRVYKVYRLYEKVLSA